MKILYTSEAVRTAIIDLFAKGKGRRVAVVGFVGSGAESYLRKPEGIELFCWPKAGGTNPNAMRRLASTGVIIRFVDRLHMKLFWAEGGGCVVTSANLSTNALGSGDLKEFGVLLRASDVNITRVLQSIKSRPLSTKELIQLDRAHQLL